MNIAINTSYKNLNIRQLQAYAALCLKEYCESLNISHSEIDNLVAHLFGILISDDLPAWEQAGASLAIPGRGDPIPEAIEEAIPTQYLDGFSRLVEYCIEVGIVDMYGAPSALPLEFLEKCLAILNDSQAQPPSGKEINEVRQRGDVWGEPLGADDYRQLVDHYKIRL